MRYFGLDAGYWQTCAISASDDTIETARTRSTAIVVDNRHTTQLAVCLQHVVFIVSLLPFGSEYLPLHRGHHCIITRFLYLHAYLLRKKIEIDAKIIQIMGKYC